MIRDLSVQGRVLPIQARIVFNGLIDLPFLSIGTFEQEAGSITPPAIVAPLREQLKQGDKSLVGNRGYRRYLETKRSPRGGGTRVRVG